MEPCTNAEWLLDKEDGVCPACGYEWHCEHCGEGIYNGHIIFHGGRYLWACYEVDEMELKNGS